MKINPLFKNFLATTDEQKRGLEEQILKDKKIIYPLVVGTYPDENGEIQEYLIDGHNRYDIAIKHKLHYDVTEPLEFGNIGAVYEWIFNQQKNKRNWNEWQEFEAVKKLKEVLAEIGKQTQGRRTDLLSIVDKRLEPDVVLSTVDKTESVTNKSPLSTIDKGVIEPHDTRKAIAEKIGWSTGKVAMAEIVAKNASVETIEKLQKQEISIHEAYRDVKREQKKVEIEKIKTAEPKPFDGLYDVIVIDPPWPMEKVERECRPNQTESLDYPTMTEEELNGINIPSADETHIFLWTTNKFLPMSFRLLDKWDLKYVLCMTWCKNGGFQPVGLPQYNSEFCLYARKGSPKFIDTKDFKVCFHGQRREHSTISLSDIHVLPE